MTHTKGPQIPVAKLAEYVVANTTAQRTAIIKSCIEVPEYLFRYGKVQKAIGLSLVAGNKRPLQQVIVSLKQQVPNSGEHSQRLDDAIECAMAADFLLESSAIANLQVERPPLLSKQLIIERVRVIVAPQCLFVSSLPNGTSKLGSLKCYTSKSRPLSELVANLMGTMLHWFVEAFHEDRVIDPAICFIPDTFGQRIYQAPKSFTRRRQKLMHACQEIHDRWDSVAARLHKESSGEGETVTIPA
jgi:hypothetical protein